MPKVAQYGLPETRTQVVRQPRAGNVASGAFGGPIADALGNVAGIAADTQKRISITKAEEALVRFERDKNQFFFNPESGYFNTQGKDAFDGAEGATKSLADLQKRYIEELDDETAKQLFTKASNAHVTRGNADVMRHAQKGLQAYEVATLEAQVENTVENASLYWNDPDRLRLQVVIGEQAIIDSAKMQGLTGEPLAEKLQTYRSAFYKSTVSTAIANSSAAGSEALERYGNLLEGPDKIKMESKLVTKQKTEETEYIARTAGTTAVSIVNKYDNLSDMMEEVNTIENDKLREQVMSEVRTQYNIQKTIKKEAQHESYSAGIDFINGGGTPNAFAAQNPEAWNGMTPTQRNNLLNGKHMISDQVLLQDLLSLPKDELAKVNPAEYSEKLKPADINKVRSAVDDAKKGNSISRVTSLSAKMTGIAESVYGKKSTWNTNDVKYKNVTNLMTAIQGVIEDAENQKGSKLTPTEENEVLSTFTRELVVEKSIGGIDFLAPDVEFNLSNMPAADMRAINMAIDSITTSYKKEPQQIGSDIATIVQALVDRGIPVTQENILNAYRQAIE